MQSECLTSSANYVFGCVQRQRQQRHIIFEPHTRSIALHAWRVLALLSLAVVAHRPAFAGCEALSICNKTIHMRIEISSSGGSIGTVNSRTYIGKNGNIYIIGDSTGVATNKIGGNIVGILCSESGSETVEVCPGANTCTNRTRNTEQFNYSSTTRTRCTATYNSEGFVLRSEDHTVSKSHSISGDQTSISHGTSESTHYLRGNSCSFTGTGTWEDSTDNTWGVPSNNTIRSSSHSLSCRILDGRRL